MTQLQSIREQRHDQIYPTLDPLEIERLRLTAVQPVHVAGYIEELSGGDMHADHISTNVRSDECGVLSKGRVSSVR